jgi:hypothetical protein
MIDKKYNHWVKELIDDLVMEIIMIFCNISLLLIIIYGIIRLFS